MFVMKLHHYHLCIYYNKLITVLQIKFEGNRKLSFLDKEVKRLTSSFKERLFHGLAPL